jgi:hypothetical protein
MMMMMVPTFAVTTAHPFVLTVSHGLLFRQPLFLQRHACRRFFSIHPKPITSAERRTKFRLNGQSRYSGSILGLAVTTAVTTPANQAFPRPVWPRCSKLFAARQPRLPTRRTHETSRSEHDLNLAILYAVQSGFRYSASLLCLTCAADLLEPTIMEPTIMLRAFKATRHPHPRAIP